MGLSLTAQTAAAARPDLFFYPPPWTFSDGSVISSPLTVAEQQATTDFPTISEMAGVVVIFNWSKICPSEHQCDFSMADHILQYWHSQNKKVVLAFATVGFPTKEVSQSGVAFFNATPDWVLRQVATYSATVPTLGNISGNNHAAATYPVYSDHRFTDLVQEFVHQLSRFDGNPTVAQLRISTGMLSEDNPNPVGALKYQIPGFTNLDWVAYCRWISDIYGQDFHRTNLEFDLGVVGWISAIGTPTERAAADSLIGDLIARKTFLAFDGWSDRSAAQLGAAPNNGESRNLQVLQQAKKAGNRIGLEAIGPITSASMQHPDDLARAVDILAPDRIVMFSLVPAYLKVKREGPSGATKTAMDFLNAQPTADASKSHIEALMTLLSAH